MNLIVVGASYRSAPLGILERLSRVPTAESLAAVLAGPHVAEAVVLSTCNRVEVYAAAPTFHAGLAQIGEVLAAQAGVPAEQLANSLYVHHGVDAVRHVFRVASGVDSMVAGEAQILGQLRDAYQQASDAETTGRVLHELLQQALRVGKRAHAETGIDRAPRNMVTAALDLAAVAPKKTLVVGAGAMGALTLSELAKRDYTDITVVNRGEERAQRLAANYNVQWAPFESLRTLLQTADLVVTATTAIEPVLTADDLRGLSLTVIDLALPRDVDPAAAALPGVTLIDVERLGEALGAPAELAEVERIVATEVEAYTVWLRGSEIAPAVAALRARADDVVTTELRRLAQRVPSLDDDQRAEVAYAVHRIVQRLLHQPTVRVKQLAAEQGGVAYAQILKDLFDLDLKTATLADVPAVSEVSE